MRTGLPRFVCALPLLALLGAGAIAAEKKKPQPDVSPYRPKNVLEYYRLIPDEIFPATHVPDRDKAIVVKDIPNGYLRIEGEWEGFGEVALFRLQDPRRALIGVTRADCGPECTQIVRFMEYFADQWIDRTMAVLPEVSPAEITERYRKRKAPSDPDWGDEVPTLLLLPRRGTTLKLVVQPEFVKKEIVLFTFTFDRAQFSLNPF